METFKEIRESPETFNERMSEVSYMQMNLNQIQRREREEFESWIDKNPPPPIYDDELSEPPIDGTDIRPQGEKVNYRHPDDYVKPSVLDDLMDDDGTMMIGEGWDDYMINTKNVYLLFDEDELREAIKIRNEYFAEE